jgi:hypothetical protein
MARVGIQIFLKIRKINGQIKKILGPTLHVMNDFQDTVPLT